MITQYRLKFDHWYKQRITRERIFIILLGWSLIYAIAYFLFFRGQEYQKILVQQQITQKLKEIKSWRAQINALTQIATTPSYKIWVKQQNMLKLVKERYKNYILPQGQKGWTDVVKQVLLSQQNINIDEIKYYPESVFNSEGILDKETKIYEQKVGVTVYSGYFDTIHYLQRLEQALPNIQWNILNYQVTEYPLAKVELEFSLLYEKPKQN